MTDLERARRLAAALDGVPRWLSRLMAAVERIDPEAAAVLPERAGARRLSDTQLARRLVKASLASILGRLFLWSESPEGAERWVHIHQRLAMDQARRRRRCK